MGRISDVELERLKREVALQRLVEAKGVQLQKRGESLVGRCPFHEDKTPSLVVTPKKNLWHCLGACRTGGTVIDWVMKAEGVSFLHAVELLRNGSPLSPTPAGAVKESTVRRLPPPVDAGAEDAAVVDQVVRYYQQRLQETPTALEYLKSRGLDSAELLAHFRVGFADRTLGLRLPAANRKEGAEIRSRLQKLGLIRDSGHEHFNGSVVVPLVDAAGSVRGMYGRKVTPNLRPGTPLHLYLPGPHRAVFNEAALQETVVLCEAVLDALSFWAAGFKAVTCAYGVEGFTAAHLEAFQAHGVRNVLIAFDRDDAGDAGAEAVAKKLFATGIDCWRVLFPRGMDANEYACKVTPAEKSLAVVLRQAQWMGPDGKAKPAPALLPLAAHAAAPAQSSSAPALPVALEGEESPATTVATAGVEIIPATVPAAPSSSSPTPTESDDERVFTFGPRRYRVRGLAKPQGSETLRFNVLASCGEAFHVDTFDLYQAKARTHFVAAAAAELRTDAELVKQDVAHLLMQLETLLEARAAAKAGPKVPVLTEEEREQALALLNTSGLLERVVADFGRCGMVGEESNALVGYLAAVSRKLEEPLAVLIQSSSAAGKSSLMEAVLAFVPEEEKVKYSAMTGQALFYMGDADLKHKVLAVVEEEGASRAAYALKLLQSEGELTIASTGKNPHTGKLETHEYHVEGPTQLFLTTTASELDEELLNRCLVLTVDEEQAQTQAIHQLQRRRRTLEGLLEKRQREAVLKLHQNAQRLLRPLAVVNPFALQLTFPDGRTRARRDFPKYLTLISSIALLHQYQRPVKTAQSAAGTVEYIEATADDVAVANRLAAAVLGRSVDELPPQTRRLLHQVQALASKRATDEKTPVQAVHFSRRELREALGWRNSQLALHLARLVDFELLHTQRAPGRGGVLVYGLHAGVEAAAPVLKGLAEVAAPGPGTTSNFPGGAGTFRPPSGGLPGVGAGRKNAGEDSAFASGLELSGATARALPPLKNGAAVASYVQVRR